jgi:hypothetical protein
LRGQVCAGQICKGQICWCQVYQRLAGSSRELFVNQRCGGSIAAPRRHAGYLQNPDAAVERDRDHIFAFHIAARRYHPIAVNPDVPGDDERRGSGSRTYDARIPQPPVDPLPVVRHLSADLQRRSLAAASS